MGRLTARPARLPLGEGDSPAPTFGTDSYPQLSGDSRMFTLTIETDNAVFSERPEAEIASHLRRLADYIRDRSLEPDYGEGTIRDTNGNRVGRWCYAGEVLESSD